MNSSPAMTRQDELGDVTQAFGQMFDRVRYEIQERKQAEADLLGSRKPPFSLPTWWTLWD